MLNSYNNLSKKKQFNKQFIIINEKNDTSLITNNISYEDLSNYNQSRFIFEFFLNNILLLLRICILFVSCFSLNNFLR